MALTEARIKACVSHDELFKLLSEELHARLPHGTTRDLDLFLRRSRLVPVGLRAMVATYEFDVSLTLDDVGWHFCNWGHQGYCAETLWALRELEAVEYADVFAQACEMARPFWDQTAIDWENFSEWYSQTNFAEMTLPLSRQLWKRQSVDDGIFGYWTKYAWKYPHKVTEAIPQ